MHDKKDGRFRIFCSPLGNPQYSLVSENLQSPAINKTVPVSRPGLSQPYFTMDLWGICTYYNKNDLPVEYTLNMLLSFKCIAIHKKTGAQSSYLHSSQPFYFHSSEILLFFLMHVLPLPHRYLLLHYFYLTWLNMVPSPFNTKNSKSAYFCLEIISTLFPKCLSPLLPGDMLMQMFAGNIVMWTTDCYL